MSKKSSEELLGELGQKGGLWESVVEIEHFTKPENDEHLSFLFFYPFYPFVQNR